jgi:3-phosphoshikimate 1-carboxyvinyltransferase
MGANIEITDEQILNGEKSGHILIRNSNLMGITIQGNIIPRLIDEIPILAVAATQAEGKTIIKNAEELKVKESNRIDMMVTQLKKMGANIEETEDGMIIQGPTMLNGLEVNSGGDHRIAMALTIAGMVAQGETKVLGSNCISISFPEFEYILNKIVI